MKLLANLKLVHKLPLALLASAIVVSAGVGVGSYIVASRALEAQARQNLDTIAFERANQLATYLSAVQADLTQTALSENAQQAVGNFANAWTRILGDDPAAALKQIFITDNPNPPAQRMMLDEAKGITPAYSVTHSHYQPVFREQITSADYRDLYIFDPDGDLVYSTAKRDDFATNFAAGGGRYAATALGDVYRRAMTDETPAAIEFADFSRYPAIPEEPVSFFAKPVFNADGNKLGVIAIALPADRLSGAIGNRTGLGRTGDVIAVGTDGLARSNSQMTAEDDVLAPTIFDQVVEDAATGVPGITEADGFRGEDVLVSAASVDVTASEGWALLALMDKDEIFAPVTQLFTMMLGIGAGLLVLVGIAGFAFSRGLTRPITRLTATMEALAEGDLGREVEDAGRTDEVGQMAQAVEVFKQNALKVNEMTDAEAARIIRDREARAEMMQALQRAFGEVVDAAIAGDFSRRVNASFDDIELNALADSINELCETVDRGLGETADVLAALAHTDLTRRVEGDYQGAFARLKSDTNQVAENLNEIVVGLKHTSRELKLATGEILSGANDLSERTSKQAATIEETSAAMEQLANTVMKNAERAKDALSVAASVTRTAEEGGQVMHQATDAMERITHSSSKISNIIGLIDDIAFQTNLLALNASVEAARAGEAGKGFAVVAVEVRRLAQSAAEASSEVKALIEQSGSEVKGGSKLVAEAAGKLEAMLQAARSANDIMNSIAKDSQEQASAIEEVNSAVRQMDEMTQHNAALVEQTNASIEQTEAQATELDRIVEVFRISGTDGTGERARPALARGLASGVQMLQERARSAARAYLANGNAAVDKDWSEF